MTAGALLGHGCVAIQTRLLQALQILLPQLILLAAQLVQIFPGEQAAFMAVAEEGLDGVVAHRLHRHNADLALAGLQHLLARAMADAIQASKMRWALLDDSLAPLTLAEAFYLGTAGGGAFFGKVGRFEPGYAFDALVIDDSDFETTADYNGLIQRLERLVYLGRDDQIVAKYVGGKPVF